jgi:hypothetical protein
MTRLALQTWAEALRDPVLQNVPALYLQTLDHIAELAGRWRKDTSRRIGYQRRCRNPVFAHARSDRDAPPRRRRAV